MAGHTTHSSAFISIHAPLAGSDAQSDIYAGRLKDFNPRSPRGERLCD